MKINYDPSADVIYISLTNTNKSTKTVEVTDSLNLDYSGKNLIGIEILDASKKLGKKDLGNATFTFPIGKKSNFRTAAI